MGLIGSILSGVTSLLGGNAAINAQKEINQQNIDFMREQREYDSPVNAAARLRAAGINPALAGLDNAGGMSLPELGSSSPEIAAAAKGAADAIEGYSSRNLEERRLSMEEKHLENQDNLARMEFDNDSIKLASEMRSADDEHIRNMIQNSQNIDNMALAAAISGRKPTGLPDDLQKQFDEAYSRISADDPDLVLARAEMEKGTSDAEIQRLINEQRKKFYIENPLYESMKVDLLVRQATEQANLHRIGLQNQGQQMENDFYKGSAATRLSELEGEAAENAANRGYRKTRVSELQFEIQRLKYSIAKSRGPVKRALEGDLAKAQSALDLLTSGRNTDNTPTTAMDVLSPFGGLAAGGAAVKKILK